MDDATFSTTREACDPVKGCPCSCDRGWAEVMDEVNQALRSPDPLERNRQITAAYERLAAADPRNMWVRLASYVSVQGGCKMREFGPLWRRAGYGIVTLGSPHSAAIDALQDANRTIFYSIYPVIRFAQKCGAKRLRECSGAGKIKPKIPDELLDALDKMEAGQLRDASDMIANYEQVKVVQPVYEAHKAAFASMMNAEKRIPGDQTSIAIAKTCTSNDLVSVEGLDVTKAVDRVSYYERLIGRMLTLER